MSTGAHYVKRATLTSKKNWWLVQAGDDEEPEDITLTSNSFASADTVVSGDSKPFSPTPGLRALRSPVDPSLAPSSQVFQVPRHPSSIFSFPTPTSYAAPPDPTANIAPFATGSASELFKCVVKRPEVVQLEVNGELQSNASDVTTQFLAELRVYTTISRHRNVCAFLGCLEGLGLVLEYIEGHTLWDAIRTQPLPLTQDRKIDYHNQLLSGLVHLHSFRLSHGDLSLLNVHITQSNDTIRLLDFGRSVSADSVFRSPDEDPVDPFAHLQDALATSLKNPRRHAFSSPVRDSAKPNLGGTLPAVAAEPERKVEQIHPGTRPFSAPEVLRGECQNPLLADAYSFGMILVCLDREETVDVKPWDQRKDLLPKGFLDSCTLFGERAAEYLKKWDARRRLTSADELPLP